MKGEIKMVDQNCAYCVEGELLAKFGIKICELENSKVYLFKEQSHPTHTHLCILVQDGNADDVLYLHMHHSSLLQV